jgi:hypothetical protein
MKCPTCSEEMHYIGRSSSQLHILWCINCGTLCCEGIINSPCLADSLREVRGWPAGRRVVASNLPEPAPRPRRVLERN